MNVRLERQRETKTATVYTAPRWDAAVKSVYVITQALLDEYNEISDEIILDIQMLHKV